MKELLTNLGLTEEQAETVAKEIEKLPMIPKQRFDEVNNKKKALQEEITKYEQSIEELKNNANGNEELTKQIEELQNAQSTLKSEYEQKLVQERLNAALKLELNGKFHDIDYTIGKLNKDLIKVDENGKIIEGLNEQVEAIKEQYAFNVIQPKQEETEQIPPTNILGWKPAQPPKQDDTPTSLGAQFAAMMNGK